MAEQMSLQEAKEQLRAALADVQFDAFDSVRKAPLRCLLGALAAGLLAGRLCSPRLAWACISRLLRL